LVLFSCIVIGAAIHQRREAQTRRTAERRSNKSSCSTADFAGRHQGVGSQREEKGSDATKDNQVKSTIVTLGADDLIEISVYNVPGIG